MTPLRLTRRRLLGCLGGVGAALTGLYAVPPRRVSASLTVPEWVLTVRGQRTPSVPRLDDLEPDAREAVAAAIDGGYESSDPPNALRDRLSVRRETYVATETGSGVEFYRLDATLPVYEVWLEPVSEEAAASGEDATEPVSWEELEECTHPDPRGFVPPPRGSEDDPYRTYYLDPRTRSCIEAHPYVRVGDGVSRYHVSVDDPGAPYTVAATPVSAATVADVEGAVVGWADVPADARAVLAEAFEDGDDVVERQSVPESLRGVAAEYDWVRRGETFAAVDLDHVGAAPIRLSATVTDPESRELDPAWLRLSVTNVGSEVVTLSTGPPVPFGVLTARRDDGGDGSHGGDGRLLLWANEYVESRFVGTAAGRVTGAVGVGRVVELAPGETRATRYAVRRNPGRLPAGTYRVEDGFGVRVAGGEESTTYRYRLRLDLG